MIDIEKYKIESLPFNLIKKGDLVYYEGPLTSHFVDEKNDKHYIYHWIDYSDTYNRWLVFEVTVKSLKLFFEKLISEHDLLTEFKNIYVLDLEDDINNKIVYKCPIDIFLHKIPTKNCFYNDYFNTDYCNELIEKINLIDYKIESLPLNLEFQGNIFKDYDVYTEHYIDKNTNEHYIGCEYEYDSWTLYKVDAESLKQLFNKEISAYEFIIKNNSHIYMIYKDENNQDKDFYYIPIELLEDDMPSNKQFYDDKYSTNYTEVLINKLYNKE